MIASVLPDVSGLDKVFDYLVPESLEATVEVGTRVRVEQLFGKVPARRKVLRSARSEYAACLDVVKRLAMARPEVGFTLDHGGRRLLALQPGQELTDRVAQIVARELKDNGVEIALERGGLRLSGIATTACCASGHSASTCCSTAPSATISPPILANRLARPTIRTNPSASISTISPVSCQPSCGGTS